MGSNTDVRPATYIPHVRIIIIFGRILRDVRTIDSYYTYARDDGSKQNSLYVCTTVQYKKVSLAKIQLVKMDDSQTEFVLQCKY